MRFGIDIPDNRPNFLSMIPSLPARRPTPILPPAVLENWFHRQAIMVSGSTESDRESQRSRPSVGRMDFCREQAYEDAGHQGVTKSRGSPAVESGVRPADLRRIDGCAGLGGKTRANVSVGSIRILARKGHGSGKGVGHTVAPAVLGRRCSEVRNREQGADAGTPQTGTARGIAPRVEDASRVALGQAVLIGLA